MIQSILSAEVLVSIEYARIKVTSISPSTIVFCMYSIEKDDISSTTLYRVVVTAYGLTEPIKAHGAEASSRSDMKYGNQNTSTDIALLFHSLLSLT
jgi:hypothetical protein